MDSGKLEDVSAGADRILWAKYIVIVGVPVFAVLIALLCALFAPFSLTALYQVITVQPVGVGVIFAGSVVGLGLIAISLVPLGLVCVGMMPIGIVSIGLMPIGIIAVGPFAYGLITIREPWVPHALPITGEQTGYYNRTGPIPISTVVAQTRPLTGLNAGRMTVPRTTPFTT